MAQCTLSPQEFIQNSFSPVLGAMCSDQAEQICKKNNLSFVELVQPFCKINNDAYFQDPSGNKVIVKNLKVNVQDVNARPPQPTLARKMLNDSVASGTCDRTSTIHLGELDLVLPSSLPWYESWRDMFFHVQFPSDHEFTKHLIGCLLVVSSNDNNPLETITHMSLQLNQMQIQSPSKLPKWFSTNILRIYVLIHDKTDGEEEKAQRHFENMKQSYGVNQCFLLQINSRPFGQELNAHLPDPWNQFLTKRVDGQVNDTGSDQDSSPRTPVEPMSMMPNSVQMDTPIGTPHTNSCPSSGPPSSPPTPLPQRAAAVPSETVFIHPLSPDMETTGLPGDLNQGNALSTSTDSLTVNGGFNNIVNKNVWNSTPAQTQQIVHGACLDTTDLEALKCFVQDFAVRALIPYAEQHISSINDIVSNRKAVSRSIFSATKRWFGTGKPGQAPSANAVIYSADSPELQLRRLADLCFMFQHYGMAFQAYHSAKRDFSADQAWLHYAGALEMAALSAFMQGESNRKTCDYMEESINIYLNCCKMPQFATRATLLSSEYLKSKQQYIEAAKQLIRMTSEDSDLRSALLLEKAAYCFLSSLKPRMIRKYAFHIVLAGHRYSKSGQKRHSLRCYKQAYQVYESRGWRLAEDHINFTIGRLAINLNQGSESVEALTRLLRPGSQQNASQQSAFLKEFLISHNQIKSSEEPSARLPFLALPILISDSTHVLTAPAPPLSTPGQVCASGTPLIISEPVQYQHLCGPSLPEAVSSDKLWSKLEEILVHQAQGQLPMIFKPTNILFTRETNNTSNPIAVVSEPIRLSIELLNPLLIPLPLSNIQLLWSFTFNDPQNPSSPGTVCNESLLATQGSEHSEDYLQSIVCTQCVDSIVLPVDCCTRISLSLIPLHVGDLKITGISYDLCNNSMGTDLAPGITLSSRGKLEFAIKGVRLKNVKEKNGVPQYAVDKRLDIIVAHEAPSLQARFTILPDDILAEELLPVTVELCNAGTVPMCNVFLGTPTPWLIAIEDNNTSEISTELKEKSGIREFNDEPYEYESPSLRDKESRKQHTIQIPLPDANGTLLPAHSHTFILWLRAPANRGHQKVHILFYYENVDPKAIPRYRLLRHTWNVTVHEAIQVNAVAKRSERLNSKPNLSVNNMVIENDISDCKNVKDPSILPSSSSDISISSAIDSLRPTSEVINIMVRIKNINEPHHSLVIELITTEASLLSPCWILEDVCTVEGAKLQSQEQFFLVLRARRYLNNKPGKKYMSEIALNTPAGASQTSCSDSFSTASQDFIKKFQTNYINIYETISIGDLNSQTQKNPLSSTEIMNPAETIDKLNSCLVLKWNCDISDNASNARTAFGQIYLKLDKLNCSVTVPETKVIKSSSEHATNLVLFGPDRTLADKTSSVLTNKDVMQKLLIRFGLKHPAQIEHDFKLQSVCLVPVQMLVSNNSDVELMTTIDSVTNTSSGSGVTFSSDKGSYKWVGLSQVQISIKPHQTRVVDLTMAAGAPRTYDLGTHLSLLTTVNGVVHRQISHVKNILVIKQSQDSD
ncbi:trafficking protein particle complex subunit 8 isoform X2 [Ctenocephalides felis]|uniref:trafficking protein particle complex subunit 8 isoform X2 n=1 Tax=Ctenocephalides felis TaxID=7515 RepID=UPI000E6E54CA|nr:trafficking protein particle complex subunit 8 isoform X2 [Ctenocephalides felis]